MIKKIAIGTILSALIFFSISFLTVLFQVNSPFHRYEYFKNKIGFPFIYYHEFMADCPIPNSGWNLGNLILDSDVTWIIVVSLYLIFNRKNNVHINDKRFNN